jgi:hypothetical protein
MGFATHLGPWLLGTVKSTTGTTAGTVQNTGATIVAQTFNLTAAQVISAAATPTTVGFIPAGAAITSVQFLTTTLFASATTLKATIAGVDVATASTITTAGTITVSPATTFTPTQANVGATDAAITLTATGASATGAVTVLIAYMMRNTDGAMAPSTFQN